jgi:adsorption protein B
LTLFAAVGFLVFALDDLMVDLIYFSRSLWRSLTV